VASLIVLASEVDSQSINEFIQRRGTVFLMRYSIVLILSD